MNILKVVRSLFGDISDEAAESIIWGCTGYPSFFPKGDVAKIFYKQLHHAKRSLDRGFTIDEIYSGLDLKRSKQ